LATILWRSSISLWLILCLIIIEYIYISYIDPLIVPIERQPNIEPGLKDHTIIDLILFNTILETANTQVDLERSWEVIEQYISI